MLLSWILLLTLFHAPILKGGAFGEQTSDRGVTQRSTLCSVHPYMYRQTIDELTPCFWQTLFYHMQTYWIRIIIQPYTIKTTIPKHLICSISISHPKTMYIDCAWLHCPYTEDALIMLMERLGKNAVLKVSTDYVMNNHNPLMHALITQNCVGIFTRRRWTARCAIERSIVIIDTFEFSQSVGASCLLPGFVDYISAHFICRPFYQSLNSTHHFQHKKMAAYGIEGQ